MVITSDMVWKPNEENEPESVDMTDARIFGWEIFYKRSPVRAIQMTHSFTVHTLEGVMEGKEGDYLCEGVEGERWPIKKEIFEKTYTRHDDPDLR